MFIHDPCGVCCILITYLALLYSDYVVIKWIVLQTLSNSLWGCLNAILYNTLIFVLATSHMRAVITDPGALPLAPNKSDFYTNKGPYADWTICNRCQIYRPPKAHHCHICRRCIERMDHHCPWINNCVGQRNQKFFLQFLVYVGVLSLYSVVLVSFTWMLECEGCKSDIDLKQTRIMHCVILLLISILFGLFVIAIFVDQIHGIVTGDEDEDEGPLRNKRIKRHSRNKMALLREVFGREPMMFWLLPCSSVRRKTEPYYVNHYV